MATPTPLVLSLKPCGPATDVRAGENAREALAEAAEAGGWLSTLDAAWPALEPVFSASPYLTGLARRRPEQLRRILAADPADRLEAILAQTEALAEPPTPR